MPSRRLVRVRSAARLACLQFAQQLAAHRADNCAVDTTEPEPAFQNLSPLAYALLICFLTLGAFEAALLGSSAAFAYGSSSGGAAAVWMADHWDTLVDLTYLLQFCWVLIFVAIAVLFLMWFARAYANLRVFGHVPHSSTAMVVWGFIIPILNWVQPYTMMREVWRHSAAKLERAKAVVGSWWISFVAMTVVDRLATSQASDPPQLAAFSDHVLNGASCVTDLVAIYFTLRLIRAVTSAQLRKAGPEQAVSPPFAPA